MNAGAGQGIVKKREWASYHGSPVPLRTDAFESAHDFIRAMHHRLCQPLTALACAVEIAQIGRESDAKLIAQLQDVLSQSERMMEMMAAFRQLFEAEASRGVGHHVALEHVVSEVISELLPLADLLHVKLVYRCKGSCEADMAQVLVRQVTWNLLENCIGVSAPGEEVTVELHGDTLVMCDCVQVSVVDQMDPFAYTFNKKTGTKASHLPVALSQRLIVANGGTLAATATPEGRRFEVIFRRAVAGEQA
jgi:K+-sensing histidine kinase KdpD